MSNASFSEHAAATKNNVGSMATLTRMPCVREEERIAENIMDKTYWLESFTRRWFLPDHETLPANAVDLVRTMAQELVLDTARFIRRLHGKRWHELCYYPKLETIPGDCSACDTIMYLERFVQQEIHANISGVVIDFLHEPDHTDQLKVAVQLYAWSIFHQGKHRPLVRQPEELLDYASYRMEELCGESFVHKPIREGDEETPQPGETTEQELHQLAQIFAETYTRLVQEFDAWRATHPGITVAAFPAA